MRYVINIPPIEPPTTKADIALTNVTILKYLVNIIKLVYLITCKNSKNADLFNKI